MNQTLWHLVEKEQPDFLLSIMYQEEFDPKLLKRISQETNTLTANWFCDDHWRFDNFSIRWGPHFNWVITTDKEAVAKYHQIGCHNVILSQWACNPFLTKKTNQPKKYDITFIGQLYGDRKNVIETMRTQGLDVQCWGYGWEQGRLSPHEMVTVINSSKICLNLSNASEQAHSRWLPWPWKKHPPLQIKARDFEVPGCGTLLLTGWNPTLATYFDIDKEIVCYKNKRKLIEKAKYYLTHDEERETIAARGYARVMREHTYAHRFRDIFMQMGLDKKRNGY